MRGRVGRAAIIGVLLGVAVAAGAREVILKPVRERPIWLHLDAWVHTNAGCVFSAQAWRAEAGVNWAGLKPEHRGARLRMWRDLDRFHLGPGASKEAVSSLLGVPDRVEDGSRWIYRVSKTTSAVFYFNPWGAVHVTWLRAVST